MNKRIYKLLILVIIYLVVGFFITVAYTKINLRENYVYQLFQFTQLKLCSECVKGSVSGVCPSINRLLANNDLSYPSADEYSGEIVDKHLYVEATDEEIIAMEEMDSAYLSKYSSFQCDEKYWDKPKNNAVEYYLSQYKTHPPSKSFFVQIIKNKRFIIGWPIFILPHM